MLDDEETAHVTIDHVLAFASLGSGPIDAQVLTIDAGDDVVLRADIDLATWDRAHFEGAFHLDDEADPLGWDDDRPVQLTLRLRGPMMRMYQSFEEFLEAFLNDPDSRVRHSEAWVALEAVQEFDVPDVPEAATAVGIRTSWANDD